MKIQDELDLIKKYRSKHLEIGEQMFSAYNGSLFPLDFLITATINRSMCLSKGFIELIEAKNFIAAAPLVRLQLDNCLRLFAGTLVDDPHEFALNVIKGIPVKKQKDIFNKFLTDSYLVEKINNKYPWFKNIYNNTSGYIHLSEKHFFNVVKVSKIGKKGRFNLKISDIDTFVTENDYCEAIESFLNATDVLFDFIRAWIYIKNNPEKGTANGRKIYLDEYRNSD